MTAIEIVPSGPLRARLAAPPSKSVTNRALVVAALADGESLLVDPLQSEDTEAMARCLRALGVGIEREPSGLRVRGTGGALRVPPGPLDAGASGTTMRFLTAVAALAPGPVAIEGEPGLMRRPNAPLHEALGALGADGGGIAGGEAEVDAGASSQFATAILLVAPYARRDVVLRVRNLSARGFVDLTLALMVEWGVRAEPLGDGGWRVAAGQRYRPRTYRIEHDASAAAHLHALAVATGGEIAVTNAAPTTQPDAGVADLFARMGARVTRDGDALTVAGPDEPSPVAADMRAMPDQVATVAALAALARGHSEISGVEVARGHETDRIAALAAELRALGLGVDERSDGLAIEGGGVRGVRLDPHRDHRLAMAFASIGARAPGVVIADSGCVAKTYSGFWEDAARAGLRTRQPSS